MKISTKGRYAIKLMLDLALYSKGQPVKIKEIAKRQGISEKYLEQIVATLNKAALVKSIRGSHGGYMLSEPPRNYTVGRILRTMHEGKIRRMIFAGTGAMMSPTSVQQSQPIAGICHAVVLERSGA